MRRAGLLLALCLPLAASACLNDRDTLGFELQNKPDIQRALTGRFDRFPPLYYRMRVDRLSRKGKLTPAEYDDLGVALERLARDDEALAVMERKRKLPGLAKDDLYRLYANRGTFHAHRWFRRGAKSEELAELELAEHDIALAIKTNPRAHFGREGAQLEVIRWVLALRKALTPPVTLSNWLAENLEQDIDPPQGLAGLIMLGGAWESPDVALSIAWFESQRSKYALTELGYARYKELLRMGRKPIDATLAVNDEDEVKGDVPKVFIDGEKPVEVRFAELRKEAEDWHRAKTDYMLARLSQGRHPDMDPSFWSAWKDTPMPKVPARHAKPSNAQAIAGALAGLAAIAIVAVSLLSLGIRFLLRRSR